MKLRSIIMLVVASMMSLPTFAAVGDTFQARTKEGVLVTYKILSESTKEVAVGKGGVAVAIDKSTEGELTIPNEVLGYSVIMISKNAFRHCEKLSAILFETENIMEIGETAFYHCSNLEYIEFPDGTPELPYSCCGQCTNLQKIIIPNSVKKIGEEAFVNCNKLQEIDFGEGVEDISKKAFVNCNSLSKVSLPDNIVTIGVEAFSNCDHLISFSTGDGIETIGNKAFSKNANLRSITFGSSISSIGERVLNECSKLEIIAIKRTTPISISENAFYESTNNKYLFYNNATLMVPRGSRDTYMNTPVWTLFQNIEEYDTNAIQKIKTDTDMLNFGYFTIDSKQLSKPQRGLNIIRYGNGSVKKVINK